MWSQEIQLQQINDIVKTIYKEKINKDELFLSSIKTWIKTWNIKELTILIKEIIKILVSKDNIWKIFLEIKIEESILHFIEYNKYDLVKDINYMLKQKIDCSTINIFLIAKIIRQFHYSSSFAKYNYQDVYFKSLIKAGILFLVSWIIITFFVIKYILKFMG